MKGILWSHYNHSNTLRCIVVTLSVSHDTSTRIHHHLQSTNHLDISFNLVICCCVKVDIHSFQWCRLCMGSWKRILCYVKQVLGMYWILKFWRSGANWSPLTNIILYRLYSFSSRVAELAKQLRTATNAPKASVHHVLNILQGERRVCRFFVTKPISLQIQDNEHCFWFE